MIEVQRITRKNDFVWSTKSTSDIEGFVRSKYHQLGKEINLSNSDHSYESQLLFSPKRSNYLRAFDWVIGDRVLEIGCSVGSSTRYLSQQGLIVDAIEPNHQLAQIAALNTRKFDQVKVYSEQFYYLDFGQQKYNTIILNGTHDDAILLMNSSRSAYQSALKDLLLKCRTLLTEDGKLLLAADNRQGLRYLYGATDERTLSYFYSLNRFTVSDQQHTLNLTEWRTLLSTLSFSHIQEYYLFPDYRFTNVMLGKEYCQSNPYAFQHLEGIHSKDYCHFQSFGPDELMLYQAANGHGHLGDFANSCLFILHTGQDKDEADYDFVHLPSHDRKPEHTTIIKKYRGQDIVSRMLLNPEPGNTNSMEQIEPYQGGCQLSVIWRDSILSDPRGIGFDQFLLAYFNYLQQLGSGVKPGMNIDAIANNIIVTENGQYHVIDQKWHDIDVNKNVGFVFYRAIVHFALRNMSILYYFNQINKISTLFDFLTYCCDAVGLNPSLEDLENLRKKDCKFLSTVLFDNQCYQLTDILGAPASPQQLFPFINYRFKKENYSRQQTVYFKTNFSIEYLDLVFHLPHQSKSIEAIRFYPFADQEAVEAGYFTVDKLKVSTLDETVGEHEVLALNTSKTIFEANTNQAVFYGEKNGQSVFLFNTNDTYLEFNIPGEVTKVKTDLKVEIRFKLSTSPDFEIAKYRFGQIERIMTDKITLHQEEIRSLKEELESIKKHVDDIKLSHVWHLLETYRDTFKISGYPSKNLVQKIFYFVRKFKN